MTSEVTATYTAKKQFTINVYDDDLNSNGEPIGIVGLISPDTKGGYAALKTSWPDNVSTNLNDYIISGVPDNVPENVTIAGDRWDVLKIGNSAGSLNYPNWRVSDMNDVAGKTFTIHIKSKAPSQIQVTYHFVSNGQQVGQYQTDTFDTDKTYTIDTNKFKSKIPDHYYLDSKYQIPTSVKYTDGMKANTVIDVPVYKAKVQTAKFYDITDKNG